MVWKKKNKGQNRNNNQKLNEGEKKQTRQIVRSEMNRGIETKYTVLQAGAVNVTQGSSALNYDLFANCAVGTGDTNNRIGDSITAQGIMLRLLLSPTTSPTTYPANNFIRIIIVKHYDAGSIGITEVLQLTTAGYIQITANPKHDNLERMKILYDNVIPVSSYRNSPYSLEKYISLHNTKVGFGAGSTGSPIKNGIRMYLMSYLNYATYEVPRLDFTAKVTYKDA